MSKISSLLNVRYNSKILTPTIFRRKRTLVRIIITKLNSNMSKTHNRCRFQHSFQKRFISPFAWQPLPGQPCETGLPLATLAKPSLWYRPSPGNGCQANIVYRPSPGMLVPQGVAWQPLPGGCRHNQNHGFGFTLVAMPKANTFLHLFPVDHASGE